MQQTNFWKKTICHAALPLALVLAAGKSMAQDVKPAGIKNIVIVHGAFADASGWEAAYKLLVKKGYKVTLVQNPTSSLAADTAATNAALERQDGPVVLVGHSWGGTVITESGNDPKVKALVYVAAFMPDAGESTLELVQNAKPLPVQGILTPDARGNVYLGQSTFQQTFTPGQSREKADFMYASQIPLTVEAFTDKVTHAAWHNKPVYSIKPSNDGTVSPSLEDWMNSRAKAKVTVIKGGHTLFMDNPEAVVKVIEAAAVNS
ncbi:alpha/beta hydrolase [Chitinophaga parva]|uniref:Alpha/beta hydrolase n=1 Tax=Chitinophaga parva TaxID=2169414 RepID=A0A2T7BHQ5_9BACT|nr:alpha/beta hydrolase [Chitinophaga parva]PUZ25809.1 alpha/beta hydrolase [Chitinophaga parva]